MTNSLTNPEDDQFLRFARTSVVCACVATCFWLGRGAVWLYLDRAVALAEIRLEQSQQELRLEIARRPEMTYQLAKLILGLKDEPIAYGAAEDEPADALLPENVTG